MNNFQTILGIETSCDETAAAVLQKDGHGIKILSNIVASSSELQAKFGGVIPEQAAREQLKAVIPVIETALAEASMNHELITHNQIDAIAVTYGPGLIGSLLVGVETAKTLSLTWNKPLIPINHLIGHFYANWVEGSHLPSTGKIQPNPRSADNLKYSLPRETKQRIPTFPLIGLLVSGGHTDLVLFTDHNKYQYLGGTRDDAAGECFDKCARLLGLPYPGGPEISKLAKKGNPAKIKLPKPMIGSDDFDFSFSGLKTAVSNLIASRSDFKREDLAASIEQTIMDVLIKKTLAAAKKYQADKIMVAGGVAANPNLSEGLRRSFYGEVFSPMSHNLCTDNAAMIAAAAFFAKGPINPLQLQADPNLGLL